MPIKVVIIDDNLSTRHSIKAYLSYLSKKLDMNLSVFSTDNGVEGLGYIYITSPDLIILDTTIPKYSGKEILDFLSNNARFKSEKVKVIVLKDRNEKKLEIPSHFIYVNKSNKGSFREFSSAIENALSIENRSLDKSIYKNLIGVVFKLGNKEEALRVSNNTGNYIKSIFLNIYWVFFNTYSKVLLAALVFISGKQKEENINQMNIDKRAFRTKYYPTLTVSLVVLTLLLLNLVTFGLTQFGLYKQNKEYSKALVTITVDSVADDADYNPGDGVCDISGSSGTGPCTLRAAIEEANTEDEAVDVEFNIDRYTRSVLNMSDYLPVGEGTNSSNYGKTIYDQNGEIRSVWIESTGARGESDVYLYDSRSVLSATNPLNLSDQLPEAEGTDIANEVDVYIDDSNNTVVAWSETPGIRGYSDAYVYRSDLPISISNPLNLSDTLPGLFGENNVSDLAIATDSNDNVIVTWIEGNGMSGYDNVFLFNSGLPLSASNPLNLSNDVSIQSAYQVELKINHLNEIFVLWTALHPSMSVELDVFMYRSSLPLDFLQNPINITDNYITRHTIGYSSNITDVEIDSTGEVHVVWQDSTLFGGDTDLIYYNSGEEFSDTNPMRFWDDFGQTASSPNSIVKLSISQDDTVFMAWNKDEVGSISPSGIYLYRSDENISASNPRNLSNLLPVEEGNLNATDISLATYGTDNAYVTWAEDGGSQGGSDKYFFDTTSPNPINLSALLSESEGTGDVVSLSTSAYVNSLTTDSDNEPIVTWLEGPGSRGLVDVYMYRGSKGDGTNSPNPINLSDLTDTGEAEEDPAFTELSVDSVGDKVLVSWHELTGNRGSTDRYIFEEIETYSDGFVIQPQTQLPTITKGDITIVGQSQPESDCSVQNLRVEIDGSSATGANGLVVETDEVNPVSISGLIINNFDESGIDVLNSEVIIKCNIIGLDANGDTIQSNDKGINSLGGSNLIIGGDSLIDRNIISGNTTHGINIVVDSTANIQGNYIGTDKSGLFGRPNSDGIEIRTETPGSRIGSNSGLDASTGCSGAYNLISGNSDKGIDISDFDLDGNNNSTDVDVIGNYIGIDAVGGPLPNYDGIIVDSADGVTIGGNDFSERNLISGNTRHGIYLWSVYTPDEPPVYEGGKIYDLLIQNNFIGTDRSGLVSEGNGYNGISMHVYHPSGNIHDNVISGNGFDGIFAGFRPNVESELLIIYNNRIGENYYGDPLGNGRNGMFIAGSARMTIGGSEGNGNIITSNTESGISLYNEPGDWDYAPDLITEISYNTITANGASGGIYIETDPDSSASDISITNNNFTGNSPSHIIYQRGSGISAVSNSFGNAAPDTGAIDLNASNLAQKGVFLENLFEGHIAISLDTARTQNDLNDVDNGANNLQNYPVLNMVEAYTDTKLYGSFNSESNSYYLIEAFSFGTDGDLLTQPSAHSYIGSSIIQTDSSGDYDFSTIPLTIEATIGDYDNVTTTATKCNDSNCEQLIQTSELSDGVLATQLTPTDTPEPTPTNTPAPTATNTPYPTSSGVALWHSTLDNDSSIENPLIGISPSQYAVTYDTGVIGNSAVIDGAEEGIIVPIVANTDWNPSKGSIEFYFNPTMEQDENQALVLFSIRTDSNNKIRVVKESTSGAGALGYQYVNNGINNRVVINQADYASLWNIGEWLHFMVNWDDSQGIETDLEFFINGIELPHTRYGSEINSDNFSLPATLYICTDEIGNPDPQTGICNGKIDDFKILGQTQAPAPSNTPIPTQTNTPIPTHTSTPIPTATLTVIPTPTRSPLPTASSIPASTATPIPTTSLVDVTITVSPTTEATITPSVTATLIPTEKVTKSILESILPQNTYTVPENSLVKIPAVKSIVKNLNTQLQELEVAAITSFVETSVVIAEELKPITENINYLLSLQFIGKEVAVIGTTSANVLALISPVVVTAASQPKIMFHALTWFWRRRKTKSWGIVFDRINNIPIAFARIVLVQDGKTIASETTNLEGKYGFNLNKGEYDLYISHSDYVDYHKSIKIDSDGQDLMEDIDLTPKLQKDFTSKISWTYYQIRKFISNNLFIINTLTFSVGLVYTLFMVTNAFTVLNYIILSLYLLQIVLVITFYFFKDKNLGIVIDKDTNIPIRGAILRVFNSERQLDVAITDINGRYNLYLEPGEYFIKIDAPGYIFPTETATNIVVNKLGEKLFKFTIQDEQKLGLKFYMQKYSNLHVKQQVVLSPFS